MPTQDKWRFCVQCYALFYDGFSTVIKAPGEPERNVCQAGGRHRPMGFDFVLPYGGVETPTEQGNWEYCIHCSVMFFAGFGNPGGVCAGSNEGHRLNENAYHFVLPHDVQQTPSAQGQWEYCVNCRAMYFDGYYAGHAETRYDCPAGGRHENNPSAYHFVLPHPVNPQLKVTDNALTDRTGTVHVEGAGWTPSSEVTWLSTWNNAVAGTRGSNDPGITLKTDDWGNLDGEQSFALDAYHVNMAHRLTDNVTGTVVAREGFRATA